MGPMQELVGGNVTLDLHNNEDTFNKIVRIEGETNPPSSNYKKVMSLITILISHFIFLIWN